MSAPLDPPPAPVRWLRWAAEDVKLAEHIADDEEVAPRGVCIFAHQAAEKAIKGLLVARGVTRRSFTISIGWPLGYRRRTTNDAIAAGLDRIITAACR